MLGSRRKMLLLQVDAPDAEERWFSVPGNTDNSTAAPTIHIASILILHKWQLGGKNCCKEKIYPCNNHQQIVYLPLKILRFSVLDQTEQHNALCGQSTRPIKWCGRLDLRSSVAPTPYPHIRFPRSRRCISCGTKGRISLIAPLSTPYLRA